MHSAADTTQHEYECALCTALIGQQQESGASTVSTNCHNQLPMVALLGSRLCYCCWYPDTPSLGNPVLRSLRLQLMNTHNMYTHNMHHILCDASSCLSHTSSCNYSCQCRLPCCHLITAFYIPMQYCTVVTFNIWPNKGYHARPLENKSSLPWDGQRPTRLLCIWDLTCLHSPKTSQFQPHPLWSLHNDVTNDLWQLNRGWVCSNWISHNFDAELCSNGWRPTT